VNAEFAGEDARRAWLQEEITWGSFGTPEREVRVLGDVAGFDVVELGCGTAYFSAWLARLGARPVGVDPTPAQLATARSLQSELGLEFPLIEAGAEDVPLADAAVLPGRWRDHDDAPAAVLRPEPARVGGRRTGERRVPPSYGGWVDVVVRWRFEVERLVELQAPDGAVAHPYYSDVTAEWARQWPAEQIWIAQKR
jgi:SAM-dependent methyltransferase